MAICKVKEPGPPESDFSNFYGLFTFLFLRLMTKKFWPESELERFQISRAGRDRKINTGMTKIPVQYFNFFIKTTKTNSCSCTLFTLHRQYTVYTGTGTMYRQLFKGLHK